MTTLPPGRYCSRFCIRRLTTKELCVIVPLHDGNSQTLLWSQGSMACANRYNGRRRGGGGRARVDHPTVQPADCARRCSILYVAPLVSMDNYSFFSVCRILRA